MSTITEKCGCGATFTATDGSMALVSLAAKRWREGHKHTESVGICGDRIGGFVGQPDPVCILKAGHIGAHSDGDGHWTHAHEQDAPTTAGEGERGEGC